MSEEQRRPHLVIERPALVEQRTFFGGGGGTYPRTSYRRHAAKVYGEAQSLVALVSSSPDASRTARRYFRMELPEDMATWTSAARQLGDALKAQIIGAPTKTVGHLSTTAAGLALALEELRRYAGPRSVGKSKFAPLESIGPIPAAEKVSAKARAAFEHDDEFLLSLFPDLSNAEKQAVTQALKVWLGVKNGELLSATEVESGLYLKVRASAEAVEEIAEQFLTVQSVDAVEHTLELSSRPGHPLDPSLQVLPNTAKAMACIFDSGVVAGSRYIDGSIIAREEPLGPPLSIDHGTFVASRIIYGDTLRDQEAAGQLQPGVHVLSVCTVSHDGIGNRKSASTEELMRLIRDTVARWHNKIRVYNLSQNLVSQIRSRDDTIADDVMCPLAAELDALARRYRVLFVVTAGNYPRPVDPYPSEPYPDYFVNPTTRLLAPGEAVLALTVGSVARRSNGGSVAPVGGPSPFTRRGPGFAGFRKPDLVAHGGNYGQNWQPTDDLSTAAVGSHGDRLCFGVGTSFAAPLISRLAAQLFEAIPGATPELVRALLVHFSSTANGVGDVDRLMGNGEPDGPRLLQSTRWSQTFVHTSDLPHREIRRIDFYVPKAICNRRGNRRVTIRATVAYAPETDRTLKAGYCKSHVRCKLVKLDGNGAQREVDDNDGEMVLRDRYAGMARLEKTFSRGIEGGHWQLLMEHESRWTLKQNTIPVAAVVTVEDPRQDPKIDVLAEIRREIPTQYKTTLASPVSLRV